MKSFWLSRILVLLFILELRLIPLQINGLSIENRRLVRVTGYIDKISQNVSNCKARMGIFLFEKPGYCGFSQGEKIQVIGRSKRGVIDVFFGQMRLNSAQIDKLDDDYLEKGRNNNDPGVFQVLREKIRYKFRRVLPVFEAGLVSGMLTGDKRGLSKSAYQQMVESGTIHIIVASGYNVMLVAGTLMNWLLWVFRRPLAMVVSLISVGLYVLLAGGDPPVVRAGIMAAVLLIGNLLGRKSVSWWSLLLAGWSMVLVDPWILQDASFQLSMAASVGLMIVYPLIMSHSVIKESRLIGLLDKIGVVVTASTMLSTAWIIWWHFHRVSIIGLISNALVLPLVSPIMILGVITLIGGELTAPFLYAAAHWVVSVIGFFS